MNRALTLLPLLYKATTLHICLLPALDHTAVQSAPSLILPDNQCDYWCHGQGPCRFTKKFCKFFSFRHVCYKLCPSSWRFTKKCKFFCFRHVCYKFCPSSWRFTKNFCKVFLFSSCMLQTLSIFLEIYLKILYVFLFSSCMLQTLPILVYTVH